MALALRAMTAPRVGGLAAAVVANLALLSVITTGSVDVQRSAQRTEAITYFVPPPRPPPPEEEEDVEAPPPDARPTPQAAVAPPRRPVEDDEDDVTTAITLPPAAPHTPLGLRGLLGKDPCLDPRERELRDDCPSDLRPDGDNARLAAIEQGHDRQMAQFGPQCGQAHGCLPMPTTTLNGLRPIAPKTPMSGGAARLGGLHDMVGRLPPPNWYHVDPGFGD